MVMTHLRSTVTVLRGARASERGALSSLTRLSRIALSTRRQASSGPGVGHELPPFDVSWLKRDSLLFANSIGCKASDELHFLYELHPKFAPFPTYPIVLPFKKTSQEVIDYYAAQNSGTDIPGVPKLDARRVVDGQRLMQFLKLLPPASEARQFEVRSKVLGVYDKGKPGTVVELEQLLVDKESTEVYTRIVSSRFFIGQGLWGGPKGPPSTTHPPPEGREDNPDVVSEVQLTAESAHLYRLNGDYNPLHATPEPGEKLGFGGTIMHGLHTWNLAAHELLQKLGASDPANMKEFQARFASPVKPGERLTFKMWRTGQFEHAFEEIRFTTEVQGKTVLSNGRALISCEGRQ